VPKRSWWQQAALILAVVLFCAGCGGGELSASALSKQAKSVSSLAAEGALLADDSSAGKMTRTFSRVHSSDLHKTASKTATTLASAKTKPALESKLQELARLAQAISDDLDRLGTASKSEQGSLGTKLQRAADQSSQIAESLK
jgi:hypothetical protein